MPEARRWLEDQEENHLQDENRDCPNRKWRFWNHLMIEMKITEDLQPPLHVGVGRLLDMYTSDLCIFRCITVHRGGHHQNNTKKIRELAASFFDKNRIWWGQLHKGHSSLIESYFQRGIAGNKVDNEGTFLLKYLLSHFDKIGVPQMNISI